VSSRQWRFPTGAAISISIGGSAASINIAGCCGLHPARRRTASRRPAHQLFSTTMEGSAPDLPPPTIRQHQIWACIPKTHAQVILTTALQQKIPHPPNDGSYEFRPDLSTQYRRECAVNHTVTAEIVVIETGSYWK
jgi:hypothetical protein